MLAEIGGLLGGALGQVGDALSAPRRAIWSALGLPESGSEGGVQAHRHGPGVAVDKGARVRG
jgi:hypothetical protein